jgi:hypothetical protein
MVTCARFAWRKRIAEQALRGSILFVNGSSMSSIPRVARGRNSLTESPYLVALADDLGLPVGNHVAGDLPKPRRLPTTNKKPLTQHSPDEGLFGARSLASLARRPVGCHPLRQSARINTWNSTEHADLARRLAS